MPRSVTAASASSAAPEGWPVVAPEPEEFAQLYRREFGYVWQVLRGLGVHGQELSDVTQDVFVAVHHRLPTYDRGRPLRPWLFGVAFRVALKHWNSSRAREVAREDIEVVDESPRPDEQIVALETAAVTKTRVENALGALEWERRAVLVAHDFEGLAGADIARELGISLKTVYYRLKTGREQFAAALRRSAKGA